MSLESERIQMVRKLQQLESEYATQAQQEAEARRRYNKAYAQAMLNGSGARHLRESSAVLETDALASELYRCQASLKTTDLAMRNARELLATWRTAATCWRAEAEFARMGPPGHHGA